MPVSVLRHVPFEGLGLIEPVLERYNLPVRWLEIGAILDDSDLRASSALILMGGPMSANDREPWVETELDLVRRAIRDDVPVLGVCLGAQLIAKALGAQVYRNAVKEIGWYETHWTPDGREDEVFGGLPEPAFIFQWHGETFHLPQNAVRLASTATCLNQAFRFGPRTYGLQFHPEVTPEMIEDWVAQDANCGDVRELNEPLDARLHSVSQAEIAERVFTRWMERVVLR